MTINNTMAASINKALQARLKREEKGLTKAQLKKQESNISFTEKRRRFEDRKLAKELGITIQELNNGKL